MASAEVFDVVSQRLTAEWTATPVVFENEDWPTPDTPAPFVLVELFGDFFDQASIGGGPAVTDNLWREGGVLLMHVMIPNNTGTRGARVFAKGLVDLFRGQDIGGVVFRDAAMGAGEKGEEDGNYYRMTASVTWQRDE
jgi:hypothetical protein